MYTKIMQKIKNNITQMGCDLLEFRGKPDGNYFVNRKNCIPLKHIFCWTQSFFTGMGYWAYVESKDPEILKWLYSFKQEYADKVFQTPLENMHDVGFLYLPYAVALYKLTGDEEMKNIGVKAADELAKRFEPRGGYIRAWGRMDYQTPEYVDSELAKNHFFTESKGLAIVDCMMNIPLLFWAEGVTGNKFYGRIAEVHAETTAKYFIREDNSVCHAYRFDEETGEPIKEESYCGYGIGSYWARGTAWAIYGYACCYAYTGKEKYLDLSLRLFERYIEESKGEVPVWDFRTPEGEQANLDTSAAAIVLCACNKLARFTDHEGVQKYLDIMYDKLLPYIDLGLENNGLLKEQNGKHLYSSYGDYYLVEALFVKEHPEYALW